MISSSASVASRVSSQNNDAAVADVARQNGTSGFESMLAAATSAKAAPVSNTPAAPKTADPRHDKQAAPAETHKTASEQSAAADDANDAGQATTDAGKVDPAKGTSDPAAAATDDATDPAKDVAEKVDAAAMPTQPDLSILAQIMAGLGGAAARTTKAIKGTVAADDPAVGVSEPSGASPARRAADPLMAAAAHAAGGRATTAAADATAATAASGLPATDKSTDAAAGFGAVMSQLKAGADSEAAALATAARLTPDAAAAIPTAGAIDLSSLSGATPASTIATATANARIESRVGTSAWGDEVVDQVKQFTMDKIEVASMTMNPDELGPVKVEIAYDKGQAAIHFTAERAETRQALEARFDQLKTSLNDAGIDLGNASTGQFAEGRAFEFMQQGREQRQHNESARSSGRSSGRESATAALTAAAPARTARQADGNVDLFA